MPHGNLSSNLLVYNECYGHRLELLPFIVKEKGWNCVYYLSFVKIPKRVYSNWLPTIRGTPSLMNYQYIYHTSINELAIANLTKNKNT